MRSIAQSAAAYPFDLPAFAGALLGVVARAQAVHARPAAHEPIPQPHTDDTTAPEPTPLDLAADWLHAEVGCIGIDLAKRIMMSLVTKRLALPDVPLSETEQDWLAAWDRIVAEWRAAQREVKQ